MRNKAYPDSKNNMKTTGLVKGPSRAELCFSKVLLL